MPGLRPLRRELLESALAFYEEFLRRGGDDPSILADLAATQFRVGQILADLGETTRPAPHCPGRRALRKALAARPGDVALLERQSEAWHRLGDLDYGPNSATANAAYRKAVAIRERLADAASRPSRGSAWRCRGRSTAWRSAASPSPRHSMRIAARSSCG